MELQTVTPQITNNTQLEVKISLEYDSFLSLLHLALQKYPKEIIADLYGERLNDSHLFRVKFAAYVKTIKPTKFKAATDAKRQETVARNLNSMTPYEYLGDAHTHPIYRRQPKMRPKPKELHSLIERLDERAGLGEGDILDMQKSRKFIYMVLAVSPKIIDFRNWMHINEQGTLIGSTPVNDGNPEYHYYFRAFSYDPKQKDFARARIQCQFPDNLEHFLVKQPTNQSV